MERRILKVIQTLLCRAPAVLLVRAPDCHTRWHGFDFRECLKKYVGKQISCQEVGRCGTRGDSEESTTHMRHMQARDPPSL